MAKILSVLLLWDMVDNIPSRHYIAHDMYFMWCSITSDLSVRQLTPAVRLEGKDKAIKTSLNPVTDNRVLTGIITRLSQLSRSLDDWKIHDKARAPDRVSAKQFGVSVVQTTVTETSIGQSAKWRCDETDLLVYLCP